MAIKRKTKNKKESKSIKEIKEKRIIKLVDYIGGLILVNQFHRKWYKVGES